MENAGDDMGLGLETVDLELDALLAPGRKAEPITWEIDRPLTPNDLAFLAVNRQTAPLAIKKLSERHHGLARLIAAGTGSGEAGLVMGYDPARVSNLLRDPAFSELVEFYREKVDNEFAETMGQIAGLGKDAILEIRDRLEQNPTEFKNGELLEIMKATLDRSGHGPSATQVNVNVDLQSKLDEARKRKLAALREAAEIIDITPEEPEA